MFSVSEKMKKLSCAFCGKYRKFGKPKLSYFFEQKWVLSISCHKCKNEDEKRFKEGQSIEMLTNLGLTENI